MNRRAFLTRPPHAPPRAAGPDPLPAWVRQHLKAPLPRMPRSASQATPLRIQAGLEPYTAPLDRARVVHALRRMGFGADPETVATYVGGTAEALVDALVDGALAAPLPDPPAWVDAVPPPAGSSDAAFQAYVLQNAEWVVQYRADWLPEMQAHPLRERMTLFWHNHFVTGIEAYFFAPLAHRYLTTLRTHSLGNFKDFVYDIGLDQAMLIYLNGTQNTREAPNENYARELLELFTMGPTDAQGNPNYAESDIQEIARALTGWLVDIYQFQVLFALSRHDEGEKVFFGRIGNFLYSDVIDILFEERAEAISTFICEKLYRAFVYDAPDAAIVAELAQVFRDHDFEIAPVLRVLFQSAHFFDAQVRGAQIKSPVALVVGMLAHLYAEADLENYTFFTYLAAVLEQQLLNPPNVAGWPGHRTWLTTTTFPLRWIIGDVMYAAAEITRDPRRLGQALHDPEAQYAAFDLPLALAEHLLSVPLDTLDIPEVADPFAGNLAENPIPDYITDGPAYQRSLVKIFLAGTPWYEWNLYNFGSGTRILDYLRYLAQVPEFQLT